MMISLSSFAATTKFENVDEVEGTEKHAKFAQHEFEVSMLFRLGDKYQEVTMELPCCLQIANTFVGETSRKCVRLTRLLSLKTVNN